MKNVNMLIAGFGGQGVLFIGRVIATAGLLGGKEVSWLPSYGPEMRGGTANCSVCISDEPIGSPLVTQPEVLVAMNGPSLDKFKNQVVSGGKVFIDKSLMPEATLAEDSDASLFEISATQLSNEENLQGLANMILLGKLLKETEFTSLELLEEALTSCIPARKEHLLEPNLRAIHLGMSL